MWWTCYIMNTEQTSKNIFTYMEVLCLEERNDNFWGIRRMRYLRNNNLVANKETGENLCYIRLSSGTVKLFEI